MRIVGRVFVGWAVGPALVGVGDARLMSQPIRHDLTAGKCIQQLKVRTFCLNGYL